MKAMMMVESGMDRHISTSPPSNGALAVEHLHQRHHPEGNGDAHHHALLVREEDATSAGGKAAAARSYRPFHRHSKQLPLHASSEAGQGRMLPAATSAT